MRTLKYFILLIALILQGCGNTLLFLEKDGIQSDEGIVVYSLYWPTYDITRGSCRYGTKKQRPSSRSVVKRRAKRGHTFLLGG